MRPFILSLALSAFPAFAQQQNANTVHTIIADIAEQEEALQVGNLHTGALKSNGEMRVTMDIDPGEESLVIAACDFDCGDLAITALDKDGGVVDEARPSDDGFVLTVDPAQTARLNLSVRMLDCRKPSCAFGLGLFRRE